MELLRVSLIRVDTDVEFVRLSIPTAKSYYAMTARDARELARLLLAAAATAAAEGERWTTADAAPPECPHPDA